MIEQNQKRYAPPTPLDHRVYRSIWVYYKDNKEKNIYIQMSQDPHKPHWISYCKFLEIAFHHFFDNNDFMDLVTGLYVNNHHDVLEKIKSIIKS